MSEHKNTILNLGIPDDIFDNMVRDNGTSPLYTALGLKLLSLGLGHSKLTLKVTTEHLNPWQTLHGGIMSTMLDAAMGAVVRTFGKRGVTIDLITHYLAPAHLGDKVIATGKLISGSNRIFIAEADLKNEAGEPLATARSTFYNIGNLLDSPNTQKPKED